MQLSIIVPTFNRNELARECIISILATNRAKTELIIVNDYKEQDFILNSSLWPSTIETKIINNPKQGVASARNFGASLAKGDYLIFIDDDMILTGNVLDETVAYLMSNPSHTYNANWVYPVSVEESLQKSSFGRFLISIDFHNLKGWCGNPSAWDQNKYYQSEGITSQFLGITTQLFRESGGYNEDFPYAGFEDFDFAKRMSKKNVVFIIDTSQKIFHNELDKLSPNMWLERKFRGGYTQYIAVQKGYNELIRKDGFFKTQLFLTIFKLKKLLLWILNKNYSNQRILDSIYFLIMNKMTGAYLCAGYHKAKNIHFFNNN